MALRMRRLSRALEARVAGNIYRAHPSAPRVYTGRNEASRQLELIALDCVARGDIVARAIVEELVTKEVCGLHSLPLARGPRYAVPAARGMWALLAPVR